MSPTFCAVPGGLETDVGGVQGRRTQCFGVGPVDPNVECGKRTVSRADLLERRAELGRGT
jgi:hypothetical protein